MTAEIKYFPRKHTKAAMSLAFAALRVEQDDPVLAAYLYKNAVRRLTRIIKVKEIEMQYINEQEAKDNPPNFIIFMVKL